MLKATILNIPNYYSSFYVKGLRQALDISYKPSPELEKWNYLPFIILEIKNKLIIIDNADPVCLREELYALCDYYFMTNKIKSRLEFQQDKIKPLFPHYPVNAIKDYVFLFGRKFFQNISVKNGLKEFYIQYKRPIFKNHIPIQNISPYIFFAGSIWKDEPLANFQRAAFIKACKGNSILKFEGGLIPRMDGKNQGYESLLCKRKFSVSDFSKKSARSLIVYNNPAVRGAISWRVAESFNHGSFILSLPWKIDLPIFPKHGKEIHILDDTGEINDFITYLIKNSAYRKTVALGGKAYFNTNCQPKIQAFQILNSIKE